MSMIKKISDQIGNRGRAQMRLLLVPGAGIVEFTGESIAPVCRVLSQSFEKNGKWSATTWEVELADGCQLVSYFQDFGTGEYFTSVTWSGAVAELLRQFSGGSTPADHGLTASQVEWAIRAIFPRSSAAIDAAEKSWTASGDQLADLLAAQKIYNAAHGEAQQVVADIEATEEAERLRKQADKLRAAAASAKGGTMSLADLKAMMGK